MLYSSLYGVCNLWLAVQTFTTCWLAYLLYLLWMWKRRVTLKKNLSDLCLGFLSSLCMWQQKKKRILCFMAIVLTLAGLAPVQTSQRQINQPKTGAKKNTLTLQPSRSRSVPLCSRATGEGQQACTMSGSFSRKLVGCPFLWPPVIHRNVPSGSRVLWSLHFVWLYSVETGGDRLLKKKKRHFKY